MKVAKSMLFDYAIEAVNDTIVKARVNLTMLAGSGIEYFADGFGVSCEEASHKAWGDSDCEGIIEMDIFMFDTDVCHTDYY